MGSVALIKSAIVKSLACVQKVRQEVIRVSLWLLPESAGRWVEVLVLGSAVQWARRLVRGSEPVHQFECIDCGWSLPSIESHAKIRLVCDEM
jgi:hypothetical protein